ncbi:MAG: hypothetical protein KDI88_16275 [Gammaproteobacteria bacterium]|nr:hypothetical protein [Gammaproteobacteria bacterium]
MKKKMLFCLVFAAVVLTGCVDQQSLTEEEIANQNRVDAIVTNVLFDNELDEAASYNIHKDGFLVIKFAETVPFEKYNHVVETLRSNGQMNGVRAEQGGREVCPVSGLR